MVVFLQKRLAPLAPHPREALIFWRMKKVVDVKHMLG